MPGFHHSVAVLPLLLRKFRKNYVSAVRIMLPTWKILLHRCRSHLPLCRNRRSVANMIESYFCRFAVGGQPISVLVTSSLCRYIQKDDSSNSVLARNGNGSYGTEERHSTTERQRKGGNQALRLSKVDAASSCVVVLVQAVRPRQQDEPVQSEQFLQSVLRHH